MFSFCSLILGPQNPLPYPTKSPMCGPGGAGACRPEDRGSTGSQKHLSMPLPLYCNPPGTALTSAPGGVEKRCLNEWRCSCVCGVRAWVCFSLPLNTPFWVWIATHGGCTTTSSVPPPLQSPHMKSLTWLNVSSSHPDIAARSSRLTPQKRCPSP